MAVTHAAITGWGKCLPPAVLTNHDLSSMLDTSDEWIVSRTGIRERRISHVGLEELAYVAAARALAAAGLAGSSVELIVFGTCSHDDQVPNMASGIQRAHRRPAGRRLRHQHRLHQLPLRAVDRHGAHPHRRGAQCAGDRRRAHLAVHGLDATATSRCCSATAPPRWCWKRATREEGLLAEKLGCYGEAREILRVQGMGGTYANRGVLYGITRWQFEGQEIFKRAVAGMSGACEEALARLHKTAADVDLVVPHQANLRIIEAVAKRAGLPMERVFVNIQRYGNMSSATVPVALCEALEAGRVRAGRAAAAAGLRRRAVVLRARGALGRARHAARHDGRWSCRRTSCPRAEILRRCLERKTHPAPGAASAHPFG